MADAGVNLPRNLKTARRVACEHRGGQTVLRVISKPDRVRFIFGANDADHRSEAFVAINFHVGIDAVDHGRRHQNRFRRPARKNPGAL